MGIASYLIADAVDLVMASGDAPNMPRSARLRGRARRGLGKTARPEGGEDDAVLREGLRQLFRDRVQGKDGRSTKWSKLSQGHKEE